jgi:DNA-binding NarL/FixJ family response regulator
VALVNDFQHVVDAWHDRLRSFDCIDVVELDVREDPKHQVDVALFDTFGHPSLGIDRVGRLSTEPHVGAIAVHASGLTPLQCEQFVTTGARGVMAKHQPISELIDSLLAIARGDVVVQALFRPSDSGTWPGAHLGFTECESEVAGLLMSGWSAADIGVGLMIQPVTVGEHVEAIVDKLGAQSREEAVHLLSNHSEFRSSSTASRW